MPLNSEFDFHTIWTKQEMWLSCLHPVINNKFADALLNLQKQRYEREVKASEEMSFMSKVIDSLKDKTSEAQNFDINKLRIPKSVAQVVVFNCLSAYTGYFTGLKLKFEMCREIILHFCKRYELD